MPLASGALAEGGKPALREFAGEAYAVLFTVLLRRHLLRLASELDAQTWVEQPLDEGERSLAAVADWGLAEDWSDWADATG